MDPKNQDPIAKLKDQLAGLKSEQAQIANTALSRGDGLTDDENKRLKEIQDATAKMAENIALLSNALEAQEEIAKPVPSPVSSDVAAASASVAHPSPPGATSMSYSGHTVYGKDIASTSPTHGFETRQAWFKAIRSAASNPAMTDRRLTGAKAAATTYSSEGSGPDAGWAIPPQYGTEIKDAVFGEGSLLARMNPLQSTSNIYQIPVDETTDWGTSGITAASTAEAGATTESKLALANRTVTLYKASAMVNVTEEVQMDNPAVVQHIVRSMAGRLQAILNKWIANGSGAGEPWGILNAPALISATKDTSQTATTLTAGNLASMVGRCLEDPSSFFLASPSAVMAMNKLLLTANGNSGSDIQRGYGPGVLGYPVVRSGECAAMGTVKDCVFVAPSGFLSLVKGSVQNDASIHFYFSQGLTSLRSYVRYGQVPLLSAVVTPRVDTGTTLSHCVTTETRS